MKHSKQYTIRGINESLDKQIKKLARKKAQSLNTWVLDTLTRSLGLGEEEHRYYDLDYLSGQWIEDKAILKALAEQHQIDEELWK